MKKSTLLLFALGTGLLVSMTAANLSIRKSYDNLDKTNPFWNYQTILSGSFSNVKVLDNRSTWVRFRPGPHGSVGLLTDLANQHRVEASIANDTLFIKILQLDEKPGMRDWIGRNDLICITTPNLRSISGISAAIKINDLTGKILNFDLRGKSDVEVESLNADFDSISVKLSDSSALKFEMAEEVPSNGVQRAKSLKANLVGNSSLDVSHMEITELEQSVSPRSAIGLSGATLQRFKK